MKFLRGWPSPRAGGRSSWTEPPEAGARSARLDERIGAEPQEVFWFPRSGPVLDKFSLGALLISWPALILFLVSDSVEKSSFESIYCQLQTEKLGALAEELGAQTERLGALTERLGAGIGASTIRYRTRDFRATRDRLSGEIGGIELDKAPSGAE
mgnify:CR=1 FL=1